MVDELSREDVTAAVDRTVEQLLNEAGIQAPPVDALTLAQKHLTLEVVIDDRPGKHRRSVAGQVILPPGISEERRQWLTAEQIGQLQKPGILQRLGFAPGETRPLLGESPVALFAGRLLVPSAWFGSDARSAGYDLLALKQKYATASLELLAWRLLDLEQPCIITVLSDDRVQRRRSNAWRVSKELSPVEQQCLKAARVRFQPQELSRKGWRVQAWPTYQDGVERVILRSVLDE